MISSGSGIRGMALAALLVVAPGLAAFAPDPEAGVTPEARGVAQAVTAAELAAWGREIGRAHV